MDRPKCPEHISDKFLSDLLLYFGGDPDKIDFNWFWRDLNDKFPELVSKFEKYFEEEKEGDLPWAAFCLHRYCNSDVEFAKRLIQSANSGDPPFAAFWLHYEGKADRAWAEKVIESATCGSSAYSAFSMCRDCGSSREWAEKVIENSGCFRKCEAAYRMWSCAGSSRDWAERIIESCEDHFSSYIWAKLLVLNAGSTEEWFEKIKKRNLELVC